MESTLYKNQPKDLRVIETLRFDPEDGFIRLAGHIDRAENTASLLSIPFDRATVLQNLGSSVENEYSRVRLTIDRTGSVEVTTAEFIKTNKIWILDFADKLVQSNDPWLQIKTTNRVQYDEDREAMPADLDELIYLNEKGEVCEGTITNIFIENDGKLLTPKLEAGLLPGALRSELLDEGKAVEAVILKDDLEHADTVFVGNSLRGLMLAKFKKL